jgi:hypothetical protein
MLTVGLAFEPSQPQWRIAEKDGNAISEIDRSMAAKNVRVVCEHFTDENLLGGEVK